MNDSYALIVQIVLGLLVIFFFVAVFFSARTWRWPHLLFLVLCFFSLGTFAVLAALTLKTHQGWRTEAEKLAKEIVTQNQTTEHLQFGDLSKKEQEPNLRSVRAEITRILLDRGRVWRGAQPGNFDGMSVTVTVNAAGAPAAAPPAAGAAPAAPAEEKTILYVFKEYASADGRMFLPSVYLGEFSATILGNQITLSPTMPLDAEQLQQIRTNDATWALYEVLPIDGHEFFAGMDENQLRSFIPQGKLSDDAYNALITSYLRTFGPAEDTDPPETRWVKVKFKKKKTIDVDNDQMAPSDMNFFDQQGRAVASQLRRGKPVEFNDGDILIVDPTTADEWVAAGDVDVVEYVFMRPLNDYSNMFRYVFNQRKSLADKIAVVTRETKSIEDSTKLAEAQTARLQAEQTKLQEDKTNLEAEVVVVTELEQELTTQLADVRKALGDVYRTNQQLAAELAALQEKLAENIRQAETSKTAAVTQ